MLREFQRNFASGLLERKMMGKVPNGVHVDALGYGVHAHHARVSLKIAVENAFPVTKRLVGADFFATMAEQFVVTAPPTHGWLSAYGAGFPHFVAQYHPAAALPYLPDLARIEWALVRAANAQDDPVLDLKALAGIAPEALRSLLLSLHVAASLIGSPFPVFDIWRAHQHVESDEELAQIDLAKGPQNVLISRSGALEVGVVLLGPGDAAFLNALARRLPFGAVCEAAVLAEADYDLGYRLSHLVLSRALGSLIGKRP